MMGQANFVMVIFRYHSSDTLRCMGSFAIGEIDGSKPWNSMRPPIQQSPGVPAQQCIEEMRMKTGNAEKEIIKALENANSQPQLVPSACLSTSHKTCRSRISTPLVAEQAPVVSCPVSSIINTLDSNTTSRDDFTRLAEKHEIELDLAKHPSLDDGTQQYIITRYRVLHDRIKQEGLYDCRYINYLKECCRYGLLFAAFLYTLKSEWFITSAVFLGLFWQQIMFTAHDAGHLAITHIFIVDSLIGIFIADFCCGLSLGWWKSSHNVHHLVPNHPVSYPTDTLSPFFVT